MYDAVLKDIREWAKLALEDEQAVLEKVMEHENRNEPDAGAAIEKRLSLEKRLGEVEKVIAKLYEELAYHGGDVTVLELVERYIATKTGVRHNTLAGYKTVVNILKKEEFGSRRIDLVKPSDAKLWLIKLQSEDKRSYSSIHIPLDYLPAYL